jgi:hypothetical protein
VSDTRDDLYAEALDDECPCCGGEGFIFDCFDGFCADADMGCDDCTRPCPECAPTDLISRQG